MQGPQYVTRDLWLTATTWLVTLTVHADAQCTRLTLDVFVTGPVLLGLPSPTVAGATEALFVEAETRLTPRADQTVTRLNGAPPGTCGMDQWAVDVQQDVTGTGCALLGIRTPSAEYELVKREGEQLFLGARPPADSDLNAPERRPTAFNAPLNRAALR